MDINEYKLKRYGSYRLEDGNIVSEGQVAFTVFVQKPDCTICQNPVLDHHWLLLNKERLILACSFSDTENVRTENFTHYVAYNRYGGVERRIEKDVLRKMINDQDGFWQLRYSPFLPQGSIDVRINPDYDLGKKDSNWSSWDFTFVPEIY